MGLQSHTDHQALRPRQTVIAPGITCVDGLQDQIRATLDTIRAISGSGFSRLVSWPVHRPGIGTPHAGVWQRVLGDSSRATVT